MNRATRAGLIAEAIQRGQVPPNSINRGLADSVRSLGYLETIEGAGTPSQKGWQFAFTGEDHLIAWSEERIDIHDINAGQAMPTYSNRTKEPGATACAFDPNSATLACSRKPGLLEFFDFSSLAVKQALPIKSLGKVTVIRFSPNGKFWALGDDQGAVVYGPNPIAFDLKYSSFGLHGKSIEALDWADDNRHFATAAGTAAAVIWDAQSERSRVELSPDPTSTIDNVRFASEAGFSPILATAGSKGVWIWSDVLGAPRRIQPYGCGTYYNSLRAKVDIPSAAYKVAFRGRTELAAGVSNIDCSEHDAEGGVMLWNAADGAYVASVGASAGTQIQEVVFSPNGKLLFIADKVSGVWSAGIRGGGGTNFEPMWFLTSGAGSGAAFSADSKFLATSNNDGSYRVWLLDLSGFQPGAPYEPNNLRNAICLTQRCP